MQGNNKIKIKDHIILFGNNIKMNIYENSKGNNKNKKYKNVFNLIYRFPEKDDEMIKIMDETFFKRNKTKFFMINKNKYEESINHTNIYKKDEKEKQTSGKQKDIKEKKQN